MFESKDAADLWAAEGADAGASASSLAALAPPPHSFAEGSLLRTVSPAGDAMYDLADCSSASSFFVAIGTSTHVAGVRAQGVALTPEGVPDHPRDVRKRRRLEAVAHDAPAVAGACTTVSVPATAATGLAVSGDDALPSVPAVCQAVSLGKRGPPRPLVSWSYKRAGSATKGGKDDDLSSLLGVATSTVDVVAPVGVSGDSLRIFHLLVGGTSVFAPREGRRTAVGPLAAGATRRGPAGLVGAELRTAAEERGGVTTVVAEEADCTRAGATARAAPAPPRATARGNSKGTRRSTGASKGPGEALGWSGGGASGGGRAVAGGVAAAPGASGNTATPVSPADSVAAARRVAATRAESAAWRAAAPATGTPAGGGPIVPFGDKRHRPFRG